MAHATCMRALAPAHGCLGGLVIGCGGCQPSHFLQQPNSPVPACLHARYVTPGAFIESAQESGISPDVAARNWEACIQARASLYLPGGKVARMMSRNPTVLVVNDTAFAHGGLLPAHGG